MLGSPAKSKACARHWSASAGFPDDPSVACRRAWFSTGRRRVRLAQHRIHLLPPLRHARPGFGISLICVVREMPVEGAWLRLAAVGDNYFLPTILFQVSERKGRAAGRLRILDKVTNFFVKSFHSDGAQKHQNLVFSLLHAPTDTTPNFRRMTRGSPFVSKAVLAALPTPPYTSKSNTTACSTSGKTNAFTR